MKKLIKKSLLIVAVLTTIVMTGTELESNLNFKLIDSKLIDVSLKNSDGELQVSVKDTYGVVLYSESFEGTDFSKKFDLKNMPEGEYFFEIEGQTKIKKMPFVVTSNTIKFENEIISVFFKPAIRQEGDLVFVSKVALGEESLKVVLYDIDESSVLYKEEIIGDVNLGKKINIKNLNPGNYKLVVSVDSKIFVKYIKKEK